jgi:ABC-type transport system substrate-binding protein
LADGGDTLVLGLTQEPATMFTLIESSGAQEMLSYLLADPVATQLTYDYQADALKQLASVENGGATNETVEVNEGDRVYTTVGEPAELAAGVEVTDAEGNVVVYEGGPLNMLQLTVTFEFEDGLTWSDGEPVKQADFELAYKIDCDTDSGAVTYTTCQAIAENGVTFHSDTSYTVQFVPGYQYPLYFANVPFSVYPAHQVLSDGRALADVPAAEWAALPEIAATPMGYGPYILTDWVPGQSMTFEANPYYWRGEVKVPHVIVQFIADTQTAAAQLLQGQIDVLGSESLGAGAEVETLLNAQEAGEPITIELKASPTWEHIDMNLFVK